MAQITWRDVAPPDFTTALRGIGDFSRNVTSAFDGIGKSVEKFDSSQSNILNNQLALEIARNDDVNLLREQIRAGKIGGIDLTDPAVARRLSADSRQAISPDTLLARETARTSADASALQLQESRRTSEKGIKQDALAPSLAPLLIAAATGDEAAVARAAEGLQRVDWTGTGLPFITNTLKEKGGLVSTNISNATNRTSLNNSVEDRKNQQTAARIAEEIRASGNPSDYEQLLNGRSDMDDLVAGMVRRELGISSGATGASGAIAAAAGAGIGGSNLGAGVAPPKTAELGMYRAAIASIESAGSGGYSALGPPTNKGDRAYGRYQVMGANIPSWTKAALGKSMTPEEFLASPEAQDKVFDHQFGWYVQKYGSPEEAASRWFTGRSIAEGANKRDGLGTTGNAYVTKFRNALQDPQIAQARTNQDLKDVSQRMNAGVIAKAFDQAWNDNRSPREVALELLNSQAFKGKGVDVGTIVGKIGEIQARAQKAGYPINSAVAAQIILHSGKEESWLERLLPGEDLGNGTKLNWKAVDGYIDQLKDGTLRATATANEMLAVREQEFAAVVAQKDLAYARVLQARQSARNNPRYNPDLLVRAEAEYQRALQAWMLANQTRSQDLAGGSDPEEAPITVAAPTRKGLDRFLPNEAEAARMATWFTSLGRYGSLR